MWGREFERGARERDESFFLAIFSGRFRAFCAHLIAIRAPLRHHADHVSSLRKRAVVTDASKASKSGPQHVVERLSRARHRDAAYSSSSFFFHSALPQTVTLESFVWISDRPRAISSSRPCVTKKNESFSWSSNWRIPARRREREAPVKEGRELSRLVKRNRKKKTEDRRRGLWLTAPLLHSLPSRSPHLEKNKTGEAAMRDFQDCFWKDRAPRRGTVAAAAAARLAHRCRCSF